MCILCFVSDLLAGLRWAGLSGHVFLRTDEDFATFKSECDDTCAVACLNCVI